jgi:hypothetical protein
MPSRIRRYNIERLCGPKQAEVERAKENKTRDEVGGGVAGERGTRVQPVFPPRGDRVVIQGADNAAAIVLDNNPEYASDGGDFASRVSIIAGVGGHNLNDGDEIEELTPLHDAAGIYVVQKGDPQLFFGDEAILAMPALATIGNMEEVSEKIHADAVKSHVTTLADTVQVVARNGGINLYAGGVGKTMSAGTPNREFLGVNLIYGNKLEYAHDDSPYSLQPLVKGHNLERTLQDIMQRQRDMQDLIFRIKTGLLSLESMLAVHTHIAPLVGPTTPSIEALLTVGLRIPLHLYDTLSSITNYINMTIDEFNMSPVSVGSITSAWNKTN